MQYLYGSGEAAAASIQAYRALTDYVLENRGGNPEDSVVLASGATLAAPGFVRCGDRPPAVVFDVDETVLLNLGYEYQDAASGKPYDQARWERWEQTGAARVAPVPGAVEALAALRKAGVTVIFNTNRSAANAAWTVDALRRAGLGTPVHGQTLFLAGDDADGSKKDGRRATIAAKYCVIAMAGDQLGDFTDLFAAIPGVAARRAAAASPPVAKLWGHGWFVLPNPVYGSGLRGGFDDIFPADKRWSDPADQGAK
jgi:5'-nucleotidase (lipoprotein e(P4) family)